MLGHFVTIIISFAITIARAVPIGVTMNVWIWSWMVRIDFNDTPLKGKGAKYGCKYLFHSLIISRKGVEVKGKMILFHIF